MADRAKPIGAQMPCGESAMKSPVMETIMSTTSSIATRRIPTGGPAHTLAGVIKRWWVAYVTWRIERLAISRLRAMSDRQLKDIGQGPHS